VELVYLLKLSEFSQVADYLQWAIILKSLSPITWVELYSAYSRRNTFFCQ